MVQRLPKSRPTISSPAYIKALEASLSIVSLSNLPGVLPLGALDLLLQLKRILQDSIRSECLVPITLVTVLVNVKADCLSWCSDRAGRWTPPIRF